MNSDDGNSFIIQKRTNRQKYHINEMSYFTIHAKNNAPKSAAKQGILTFRQKGF